ncbi:hypothetical protein PIECOFPK_01189 [Mycovorax composti]|jgi:hypothetical protein|uniref:Uncharacterized protein n=2 Tax=Chitinophagaceae TaxID=563835 RepID=A0ABZ2EJJ8_9BACT
MRNIKLALLLVVFLLSLSVRSQVRPDSIVLKPATEVSRMDSLRIVNFSPFFSLHVDSSLSYKFLINKDPKKYYWFLKEAPVGFKMDKDNGVLSFKSNKSLFLAGRLKYDQEYPVKIGVQSLSNPLDRLDTTVRVIFYSTDVVYPRIKPSVVSPVTIVEGDRLSFSVLCENGNFPIDKILVSSDVSIGNFKLPKTCDDYFEWVPGYDFVTDQDPKGERVVNLEFIGSTNFNYADTARVKVIVKNGLNYDIATKEYNDALNNLKTWILRYKYTFLQLDKRLRKTKNWRSGFDITTATTTLTGTVLATTAGENKSKQNTGKILPSIGVVAMPVKEAAAPQRTTEQNQATLLRTNIKRLDYILTENQLSGDRDPLILVKTETLKKELRQSQTQLAEVPTEMSENLSEKQLNEYFDDPKVQKKYRLR